MDLDFRTCAEARKTRDARFDGRVFIAVLSSGVYCRPICPARTAKEENVRYFTSAAAAAEAGFRPCLRCRPECSPGTPAWMGTSATVSRALRLIGESPLEDGGVDALASRLGIGSRHLRRLFLQHLGAPPIQVALTRRLHFAKKLIDETVLSMEQVALAAGFGTVRRFNAAIRNTYKRTPTHIRRLAHKAAGCERDNEYVFRLRFRRPFDWNRMLAFLSPRATPGVEMVEAGCYRRSISLHGLDGLIEAFLEKDENAIGVRICFPDPRCLFLIVERVRYMFDINATPSDIAGHLGSDPLLAKQVAIAPGLRVPGCWDGFELAVRAILGQQVTVKGASTLAGRLVREFGTAVTPRGGITHLFPLPGVLAGADLARIGLPAARAETIRGLAEAVRDGCISFSGVDVPDFLLRFRKLAGIGDWTAQYVAMRAFGDPDAFPSGDLGLLRATGMRHARELEERSHAWRPWRAYAAMYLWQSLQERALESPRRPGGLPH